MKAVHPVVDGLEVAAVLAIEGRIDLGEKGGVVEDGVTRLVRVDELFGLGLRYRTRLIYAIFIFIRQQIILQF